MLNPGNGKVGEPGLSGVMGRGDTRKVPVSVCHQVSMIWHLPAPKCSLYHIQASGLMGSPTDPSSLMLEMSYILGPFLAGLHEHSDGCRRGVEDGYLVILDDLEPSAEVREVGSAFVHHASSTEAERAINYVGMTCDPSDISRAPPDIVILDIEDPMQSLSRTDAVSTMDVLDTLRLAGSARCVQNE